MLDLYKPGCKATEDGERLESSCLGSRSVLSYCRENKCAGYLTLETLQRISFLGHLNRVMRKPVFGIFRPGPIQTGLYNHRIYLAAA